MKTKEINAIIEHYKDNLGELDILDYKPTKDMPFKPKLVLSRASKRRDYHVLGTIGLSDLKLKGIYSNCEFVLLLDKKWKFNLESINNSWPLELVHKICNIIYLTDAEIGFGKYFVNENNSTFCPITDMSVALIGVPAMFDTKFFDLRVGKKNVNFFVITTATYEELKLIKHMGGINFIQRYLLPEGEEAFILRNNKIK